MAEALQPIIVIRKKKRGGAAHHGGAWKVAYADFVTAMMAFFMVMWLINLDPQTKTGIGGYFTNPTAYAPSSTGGVSPLSLAGARSTGQPAPVRLVLRAQEQEQFERAASALRQRIEDARGELGRTTKIEITVTEQGLRIELVEDGDGDTFFPVGSSAMSGTGRVAVALIGAELVDLTNPMILEGHTDATPYAGTTGYTNWELSADRANAARRLLETTGVPRARMIGVRGLADRYLRIPSDPRHASNRRISILLPFTDVIEAENSARAPASGA